MAIFSSFHNTPTKSSPKKKKAKKRPRPTKPPPQTNETKKPTPKAKTATNQRNHRRGQYTNLAVYRYTAFVSPPPPLYSCNVGFYRRYGRNAIPSPIFPTPPPHIGYYPIGYAKRVEYSMEHAKRKQPRSALSIRRKPLGFLTNSGIQSLMY